MTSCPTLKVPVKTGLTTEAIIFDSFKGMILRDYFVTKSSHLCIWSFCPQGRALDKAVGINHIPQPVSFGGAAAHNLHLFKEQGTARAEHVFALFELRFESDRSYLPTSERNVRYLLGDAEHALCAAAVANRERAGNSPDPRVVEAIGHQLVIWCKPLEYRRTPED